MSEKLGPVVYGKDHDEVFLGMESAKTKNFSDSYAEQIDDEIKTIVSECEARCTALLEEHNDKLVLIAETLIKEEKIGKDKFLKLMDENYNPDDEKEEVVEEITESPVVETEAENNKECEESSVSVEETTDTLVDSENEE
jgi:cell division protease FtsH